MQKTILVTGATSGFGNAIARLFAKNNFKVIITGRRADRLQNIKEELEQQYSVPVITLQFDVRNRKATEQAIASLHDKVERIDILVNNAGAEDKRGNPWEMAPEDWERTIRSHLTAPFYCIRHASGYMKDQGWGRIVNTTSRAWIETTEQPNYAAAMAGVVGLTRDVARDMGRFGVTCNAYSPFAKTRRTNIAKQERAYAAGVISKSMYEMYLNVPEPASCAPFVTYLCSEESANINGLTFGMKPHELFVYSEKAEAFSMRKEDGDWSHEELVQKVPANLLVGYVNPAPKK